jgi:hypothetical protein
VSIRVEFEGGPADGAVEEFTNLEIALPSLYWHREEIAAVYHRGATRPDPATGAWRYHLADARN